MIYTDEEAAAIWNVYSHVRSRLYDRNFVMKLAIVMNTNPKWYKDAIQCTESASSVIETAFAFNNRKKAARYCVIFEYNVRRLTEQTESDYNKKYRESLLGIR